MLIDGHQSLVTQRRDTATEEYVSAGSLSDTEQANLAQERRELAESRTFELQERQISM